MKSNIGYIILFIFLIFGCSKSEQESIIDNFGEVSFELCTDNQLHLSRTSTPIVPKEINLDIIPDDKTNGTEKRYMLSSSNGVFKRKSILNPGSYNCKAYSHKDVNKALNEEERGCAWFYSELPESEHFNITTENTTQVNLILRIANTKISLVKNGDFTNEDIFSLNKAAVFTNNAPSRKLEYLFTDADEYGWFKADEDIMIQVYFTYKGVKYYKILNLGEKSIAANHHIITLKPSVGGIGAINIQVDNGMEVEYRLVTLNVDGSILIGSATGVYMVAVDGEIDKNEGGIEFNPED